ncbi:MAG: glycosyltransferase [Anaerolineales bacterium]
MPKYSNSEQTNSILSGADGAAKEILEADAKLGVEESVTVQPAVPHHEIPALIAEADICVAPLGFSDRNVTQGACPIKVLEYMAGGRPLLASNLPIVRELAREDVDALLFSPTTPKILPNKRCYCSMILIYPND